MWNEALCVSNGVQECKIHKSSPETNGLGICIPQECRIILFAIPATTAASEPGMEKLASRVTERI